MPEWLIPVHPESILVYDNRERAGRVEGRLISPFNGLHPLQAWQNANQVLSRHNEGRLAFDPTDGVYLSMFAVKTLQPFKCVIALSMDYPTGIQCAEWGGDILALIAMQELQPQSLPSMGLIGPTYMDLKIMCTPKTGYVFALDGMRVPKGLIAHIVAQGHLGDRNMSLDQNVCYPEAIQTWRLDQQRENPSLEIRVVFSVFPRLAGPRERLLHERPLDHAGPRRPGVHAGHAEDPAGGACHTS